MCVLLKPCEFIWFMFGLCPNRLFIEIYWCWYFPDNAKNCSCAEQITVDDDKSVSKLFLCWGFRECSKDICCNLFPMAAVLRVTQLEIAKFSFLRNVWIAKLAQGVGTPAAWDCAGVVVQTGSRPRLTWSEEAGHALSTLLGLNKSNFCRLWSMEVSSLPYLPHLKLLLTF